MDKLVINGDENVCFYVVTQYNSRYQMSSDLPVCVGVLRDIPTLHSEFGLYFIRVALPELASGRETRVVT